MTVRIFVVTIGTRGDFELFLTLASALHRRGHAVVVGTSPFYGARVLDAGLSYRAIGSGSRDEMLAVLRSLAPLRGDARTAEFNARWVQPQLSSGLPELTLTAVGSEYFVSNTKMVLGRADGVIPGATVTYDPPGSLDNVSRSRRPDRQGRIMDLVAMPRALLDPEGTWPAWVRFTGFWTATEPDDRQPAADLAAFVARGSPPVVVTMGSMVMVDERRLVPVIVDALGRARQRAVIVAGWSDLASWPADDRLHVVAETPYAWLFSRAACVIHHGGTGTVAAVLRAGTPSILLPQLTAQERFGRILARAGVATGVFDVDTLRADTLADAITTAVTNTEIHAAARRWQTVVGRDPGVDGAVDAIEAHAAELVR